MHKRFTALVWLAIAHLVALFATAQAATAQPATAQPAPAQPNILLLVAEDMSPRLGSYGDEAAHTPNLDQLATVSTRYTHVFTTAGVCAPSRAAMITGQHQISFGAQHMRTSTSPLGTYLAQPPANLRAFPELLRQAGYFTFTDGKLDYQFSGIAAGSGPFTIWDIDGAREPAWRERAPGQPFFGLINLGITHESGVFRTTGTAHSETHKRTQASRSALNTPQIIQPDAVELPPYFPDLPVVRQDVARHYDNIAAMDARVGRILDALQQDGLREDTIIIWTSDHGDGLPRAKRELYDSGIHVPMLLHRPSTQGERVDDRLVSFVDLAPTILSFADIEPPAYLHGTNFLLQKRRFVFASRDRIDEVEDRQRAIRDSKYKYIRSWHPDVPGGHLLAYRDNIDMVRAWRELYLRGELTPIQARWFEGAGEEQLFDTTRDPHEVNNLANKRSLASTKRQLNQALDAFLTRVGDWSEQPEDEMRTRLLRDSELRTTPPPRSIQKDGVATLVSPIDASIGYRLPGEDRWRLYVEPIAHPRFEAKSVRYGWLESSTIEVE